MHKRISIAKVKLKHSFFSPPTSASTSSLEHDFQIFKFEFVFWNLEGVSRLNEFYLKELIQMQNQIKSVETDRRKYVQMIKARISSVRKHFYKKIIKLFTFLLCIFIVFVNFHFNYQKKNINQFLKLNN